VEPEKFLQELEDVCKSEKPDVFYPIEDISLGLSLRYPDRWRPYTRALLPPLGAFEIAYDKWKTIQLANELGIPTPDTICPVSVDEVQKFAQKSGGPYVVKPRNGSGSRGLRYVENATSLVEVYQEVASKHSSPVIQERLPAEGAGVGVSLLLSDDEVPLAVFCHKRLREYPITGGPSTLRVSIRDDRLLEQSLRLVKAIGCKGVAMVEYKFDLRKKQYSLMEVNPRFWGSLPLAIFSGVNFPLLYHQAALGISFEPVLHYATGQLCRWLLPGDLLHFLANPNRFHLQPSFFEFRNPRLAYDILSSDDPWPSVGILIESLRKLWLRNA